MARKRWEAKAEVTPELLSFREKRKWQINFRRYVLEKSPCPAYAPYFGLDIASIREWFACQFAEGLNWDNFGKAWQFEHVVPLTYFDHAEDKDLRLCWNFLNLRVEPLETEGKKGQRLDLLGASRYFGEVYAKTGYSVAGELLEKVKLIEEEEWQNASSQQAFLQANKDYLAQVGHYSAFEFELLNHGRSIEEVNKEAEMLRKNKLT